MGRADAFGAKQLGVDPGATHPSEIEVETVRHRAPEIGGNDLDLRLERTHLLRGTIPEIIKISRTGISPLIRFQLIQRHIDEWHKTPPEYFPFPYDETTGTEYILRATESPKRLANKPAIRESIKPMTDIRDFMLRIARKAGEIALAGQSTLDQDAVMFKSAKDLVTKTDREVEDYLSDEIRKKYPSHTIVGEETGTTEGTGEFAWFIDPIDGTTSFVHDQPFFSVSIGLKRNGEAVAGVVNAPRLGEIYHAVKGGGAFRNGERISVSRRDRLLDAVLSTGFACVRAGMERNNLPLFCALVPKTRDVRRFGSAAIDLSYVACGRLDGYWELFLQPYDVAAGELIVRETGGEVCDFEGGGDYPAKGTLATNGRTTREILDIVVHASKP